MTAKGSPKTCTGSTAERGTATWMSSEGHRSNAVASFRSAGRCNATSAMTNAMTECRWLKATVNAEMAQAVVPGTRQRVARVGGLSLGSAQVWLRRPLQPHEDRLHPYGPPLGGHGETGMCGHGGSSLQLADGLGAGYGVQHDRRVTERPPVIAPTCKPPPVGGGGGAVVSLRLFDP